jgi:hypothetical protein
VILEKDRINRTVLKVALLNVVTLPANLDAGLFIKTLFMELFYAYDLGNTIAEDLLKNIKGAYIQYFLPFLNINSLHYCNGPAGRC